MKQQFMVIDDSELDCFIAEKMIRHTNKSSRVILFTEAEKALNIIRETVPEKDSRMIVLLDILMPVMDGFAFMEAFERLPEEIQNNYLIVGLTSSMNKKDLARICEYRKMSRLLDKPLTSESVLLLVKEIESGELTG